MSAPEVCDDVRDHVIPARKLHADVAIAPNGVARADDDALAPDHAARRNAPARVDRYDVSADLLDRGGELRGELGEYVGLVVRCHADASE